MCGEREYNISIKRNNEDKKMQGKCENSNISEK